MNTEAICITAYLVVGIILSNHWFNDEFQKDYDELSKTGGIEDGMAVLLMLIMAVFWPIKLMYNLIRFQKV